MSQPPELRLVTEAKLLGALMPGGYIADAIAAAVGNAGGAPGGGGSGDAYTYVQAVPLATWVIPNPFGREPNVDVYVAGELVETDVRATDQLISISFPAPTVGRAALS